MADKLKHRFVKEDIDHYIRWKKGTVRPLDNFDKDFMDINDFKYWLEHIRPNSPLFKERVRNESYKKRQ